MRFQDKVAIVTGGSSGIGKEVATRFVAEGGSVVIIGRDAAKAEAAAKQIDATGKRAIAHVGDISLPATGKAAVKTALDRFGRLDVLFNNAGIFPDADGSVVDTDEAVFDRVIAVNLKGVFLGCKYGVPALLRAGGGAIINTASFVAVMGSATSQSAYTASKGGVLALTREIAVEYARRGIRANALCPGPVNTPLLAPLLADPAARERRMVHIPMGRLAEAREVAAAALFLASDESSFVNGATFLVDGGITAAYVTPLD